jgi:hypothetical protein
MKCLGCLLEQAVIVHLRLCDDPFRSSEERKSVEALEGQLERAIAEAWAGEFDGDEFGEGECVLFMYGPEADRLFDTIEPLLKISPVAAGGIRNKTIRWCPRSEGVGKACHVVSAFKARAASRSSVRNHKVAETTVRE